MVAGKTKISGGICSRFGGRIKAEKQCGGDGEDGTCLTQDGGGVVTSSMTHLASSGIAG